LESHLTNFVVIGTDVFRRSYVTVDFLGLHWSGLIIDQFQDFLEQAS